MSVEFRQAGSDSFKPVDIKKLLDELCDQPELITRLLFLFHAAAIKDLDGLEAALAAHDASKVATLAHRLKGSAATVGAEPLRVEAEQMEGLGRRGQLDQAKDHMADLRREFTRFDTFMSEWRESE